MGLLGTPDVVAISYDPLQNTAYGVRMRQRKRGSCEAVKFYHCEHGDWQHAVEKAAKKLGVNSSDYLLLILNFDHCEVFECSLPASAPDVMREALRFEVPRQLMSVPEDFRLQFVIAASDSESGQATVRCAVYPDEVAHKLANKLAAIHCKPDAVISPLLALPAEINANERVVLDGFEKNFCWQNGCWKSIPDAEIAKCNVKLDEFLKKYIHCQPEYESEFPLYRTAILGAWWGMRNFFTRNNMLGGVNILPDYLRPARFRTQLRLMALLILLLLGVNIFRYAGDFMAKYNEHSKLTNQYNTLNTKSKDIKRKIKSAEKQLKEHQRTADMKVGSRECLGYLAYLSDKLSDEVLVTNFRWSEGSLDLNMQTMSPDLDLVAFFNRLPGFKVVSASQRNNQHSGLTTANIKLSTVIEPPAPPVSKAKGKKKGKASK